MGTRVGIELSPLACRLIELESHPGARGEAPFTRVRSFAVLPRSGPETDRRLASVGRHPAAVVVWGARSDHRQVVVSKGSYETMRAEAIASVSAAGVETSGAVADIAPTPTAVEGTARQPVLLALASAHAVSAAIRPLVDRGLRIRSVITPADALLGLARARQAFAMPSGLEAYVALAETATCVALVRDGSLLSARELPWGHQNRSPTQDGGASLRGDDLAARLVDELTEFLAALGTGFDGVTQVSICGGLPELRTMTVPLMERLDVEVETLDSLFGIDVEQLPEPADEFRDRAAELRLAWAAAADWPGPINLMRHRRRRRTRVALARAAVVAGVSAGWGLGWEIEQSEWWQSTAPQPVARRSGPPAARPVQRPAATTAARMNVAPRTGVTVLQAPAAAPKPASPATMAERLTPPSVVPPTTATKPPVARVPPPIVVAPPPTATNSPILPHRVARVLPPPTQTSSEGAASSNRPVRLVKPAEPPPVPFEAVLGTILYSSDRKLALVDGRIVGVGDDVHGARIVDITPATVLLRDAQGRLRSLTLGPATPSGSTP